jgi:sensor histidine kinase regulating citrate/malate metabolism
LWSRSRLWPATLAGQVLVLQLTVLLVAVAVASVVSVQESDAAFRDTRGSGLRQEAQTLANTKIVRLSFRTDTVEANRATLTTLTQQRRTNVQASGVYLTDPDGVVLISSDFAGRDGRIDLGASTVQQLSTWTGDVDDFGTSSIAAQVPIINRQGELVGIVMVAEEYPTWRERAQSVLPDLLTFAGLGLGLGIAGSFLLSRLIRRRTRGLEPAAIAALADQREALLHSIREGVVAVAEDGTVTMMSDSARELIGLEDEVEGRRVDELDLDPAVRDLLADDAEIRDHVVVLGDRVLVVNRNPVLEGGRRVASVTTLRDRTELLALQSELSARQSITNTLRAQTHEFHNQLHTISGLVQLGEYDEVSRLVGTLSRRRREISDAVLARVEDPAVAALLIAKTSLAAERGVDLRLTDDSDLPRLDPEASTDVGTVLGNLVDNAVDASVSIGGQVVEVTLRLDGDTVRLAVADTGPGVAPGQVGEIFRRGWSTKASTAEGRGVGLALVQVVCERRGGAVTVRAGDGGTGAVFEAGLPGVQAGIQTGIQTGVQTGVEAT